MAMTNKAARFSSVTIRARNVSPRVNIQCQKIRQRRCSMNSNSTDSVVTSEMLELAQLLADEGATVTTPLFRAKLSTDIKSDRTIVTNADKEAEKRMRDMVHERLPSHSVFGEEYGYEPGQVTEDESSDFMWVFDPIDGTKAFITGKPSWGTLIALLHKGKPVLGIIDQPITQERWIGVEGKQSILNGKPISTRPCNDIGSAYMYTTTPDMFSGASKSAYRRLHDSVFTTCFGADCYGYGLLAAGFVDIVAEADLKPWDYMALVPIIEGAGGVITDWNDRPLTWKPDKDSDSITAWSGEVLAAGSPVLHSEALKTLDFTLSNPNH